MDDDDLNPDEIRLLACVEAGIEADFSDAPEARLRAETLRRLVLGLPIGGARDGGRRADGVDVRFGVQIRGASIVGRLTLANASGSHAEDACPPLMLSDCRFESERPTTGRTEGVAALDLSHAHLSRVSLVNCAISTVMLDGARIGGDVDISGLHAVAAGGQCWLRAKGTHIGGSFRAEGAVLDVEQRGGRHPADPFDYACDFREAHVSGMFLARSGFVARGGLCLPRHVGGDVRLEGAELVRRGGAGAHALNAQSSFVDGVMVMRPCESAAGIRRFRAQGPVHLYGLHVRGTLDMSGVCIDADDDPAPIGLNAPMLVVDGSLLVRPWSPSTDPKHLHRATIAGVVLFEGSRLGGWTEISLSGSERVSFDGTVCSGSLRVDDLSCPLSLRASQFADASIAVRAASTPDLDVTDANFARNLYLGGDFGTLNLWGCAVHGQFGTAEYSARLIQANEAHLGGFARFRAKRHASLHGAQCQGDVLIEALAPAPGPELSARHLSSGRDVLVRGPFHTIKLARSRIGGDLNLLDCSLNVGDFEGIRVEGRSRLPRHLFEGLSLAGGKLLGPLCVDTKLHVRRRPAGDTRPRIDLQDVDIQADLNIVKLERAPAHGMLEEKVGKPEWLDQPGALVLFERELSCYSRARVVEVHRRALPGGAGKVAPAASSGGRAVASTADAATAHDSGSEGTVPVRSAVVQAAQGGSITDRRRDPAEEDWWEAYAFLELSNGELLMLNGDASVIQGVNDSTEPSGRLDVTSAERAIDYLRFFCAYVWAEHGAFRIIDDSGADPWFEVAEQTDAAAAGATPPVAEPQDSGWRCSACVAYDGGLFQADFAIAPSGRVEMTRDAHLASIRTERIAFEKPKRRYRISADGRRFWLMEAAADWQEVADSARRAHVIARIDTLLSTTEKRHIEVDGDWVAHVDLKGCRCETLDDGQGDNWHRGVFADLRGFDYSDVGEKGGGLKRTFPSESVRVRDALGRSLGRQRCDWLNRVIAEVPSNPESNAPTRGLFSPRPYEQLVTALGKRGDLEAARTVLEKKMHEENSHRPWVQRLAYLVGLQWPFRYGLFSRRATLVALGYWLLGTFMFDIANYGQLRLLPVSSADSGMVLASLPLPIKPALVIDSQPVSLMVVSGDKGDKPVSIKVDKAPETVEEIRCGDQVESALYALDVMLPLVELHQAEKCAISGDDRPGAFAWRLFRAGYALVGAYVTSMLILTVSGVLRRTIER